jgi:SNF family Na+-dependent transporter
MAADDYFHNNVLKISDGQWQHCAQLVSNIFATGFHEFGLPQWQLVLALLVAWLAVFLVLVKGIKSVGKTVYFTSTFPYLILLSLFVNAITKDGALGGIMYYITPQWHRLADPKVWSDAAGQVCTVTIETKSIYSYTFCNCSHFKHPIKPDHPC